MFNNIIKFQLRVFKTFMSNKGDSKENKDADKTNIPKKTTVIKDESRTYIDEYKNKLIVSSYASLVFLENHEIKSVPDEIMNLYPNNHALWLIETVKLYCQQTRYLYKIYEIDVSKITEIISEEKKDRTEMEENIKVYKNTITDKDPENVKPVLEFSENESEEEVANWTEWPEIPKEE